MLASQKTQHICIAFLQRRPNVLDVGPTLYKCYTDVLRLLACHRGLQRLHFVNRQVVSSSIKWGIRLVDLVGQMAFTS